MKKIEVLCPAYYASGGPELLHQFCYEARKLGFSAEMLYMGKEKDLEHPVADQYMHYNNPYVTELNDSKDKVFIIPEIMPTILKNIKKGRIVYWWLSVDNYHKQKYSVRGINMSESILAPLVAKLKIELNRTADVFKQNICMHLVQSYYAMDYCLKQGVNKEKIMYLSDYLNDDYLNSTKDSVKYKKSNQVLYNPKKGLKFTNKIIDANNDIKWIPIINMKYSEVAELMKKSKVYIDFGNHPGKDRLPREAAVNGCCIITDRRGSAAFSQDVSIPDRYKIIDEDKNIPVIIDRIKEIFDNYDTVTHDFDSYREGIYMEHQKFISDLSKVCETITR